MNFALNLGFGVSETFFALFMQSLGARGATLGIAIAFYAATKIFFGPVMGLLVDRIGRKSILFGSLILLSLTSLLYLFVTDLQIIILLRILQGIGFAMYRPVVVALIGDLSSTRQRGSTLGTFDISFYTAIGTAPLAGGIIMDTFGFAGIFALLFIMSIIAFAACLMSFYNSPQEGRCEYHRTHIKEQLPVNHSSVSWKSHQVYTALLIYIFGRSFGIILFVSFLPILLFSKLQLTGTEIGIILATTTLITALILRPMGKLADQFSCKNMVIIGGSAVSLLYCLIPFVDSFSEMYLLGIGIGVCGGVAQPASSALLIEESVQLGSGFALGVFNAILNLGAVAGALLGSFLQSTLGIDVVFYGAGLVGLLAVSAFYIFSRTRLFETAGICCSR